MQKTNHKPLGSRTGPALQRLASALWQLDGVTASKPLVAAFRDMKSDPTPEKQRAFVFRLEPLAEGHRSKVVRRGAAETMRSIMEEIVEATPHP